VESPGEEGAAHYTDTVTFTSSEFENLLGIPLPGEPKNWFGETTYTPGQGVQTMVIGEEIYRGTVLRTKLGLRSTAFTVTVDGDTISIQTRGYGHRVGMSQYGAEAMAVAGSTWPHILAHYYPGTEVTELESFQ
jgi:stage II sporulation protein D